MTDVLALAEDAVVSNINCKRCCDVLVFVCSSGLYTGNWPERHSKPAHISLKTSAATSLYRFFFFLLDYTVARQGSVCVVFKKHKRMKTSYHL